MASIDTLLNWFYARKGKVTYSMSYRNGPNSYDCSSAVYYALIESGFLPRGTAIGNTESLYRLEGSLLQSISRSEARKGDIFVAGVKGASSGAYGHTGVFTSNSTIIHCNGADNGISETPFSGRTGSPVYCFRLKNTSGQSTPSPAQASAWKAETGIFTLSTAINLRKADSTSAGVIAILPAGSQVRYDQYRMDQNGYVWIRQPRANGAYGYLATGESKNGKRVNYWGSFK